MSFVRSTATAALLALLLSPFAALAQDQNAATGQPQDPSAPPVPSPEIDLNLVNLPTTLSIRRHRSYFRLTHRFARDLRRGSFGSLAEDLFSLDSGAIIGFEYRFGITGDLHAGVHRSMLSKTIQFFGKYDGWRQGTDLPVSLSVTASIEALNNFQDNFQPAIAATLSRGIGGNRVLLYATPAFIGRTRAADFLTGHDDHDHEHDIGGEETDEHADHEHTFFLGLGGRVRVTPGFYLAGEYTPRLAGHDPGRGAWGFAAEKYTRGHTLQLNLTNSFGTTFGQLARGGSDHDIYLGFNITRKF